MSRPDPATFRSAPQKPPTISKRPRDQTADLLKLRNHLHYLQDKVLPRQPYLVSVPSDVPYRHSSRFVHTWHYGTPFAREEEQLQYMSFLPHQEAEASLLSVVGGWCDENGRVLQEEEESPRLTHASGQNTPAGEGGRRKKISLNQYKKKGSGEAEPPVSELRDFEKQADTVNAVTTKEVKPLSKVKAVTEEGAEPRGTKRPPDDESMANTAQAKNNLTDDGAPISNLMSPRPEKRHKLKSPTPLETSLTNNVKMDEVQIPPIVPSVPKALPKLLSPSLPPSDEVSKLPRLLSPTLPPAIQEFLEAEKNMTQLDGVIEKHRTDSVRSILAAANLESMSQSGLKKDPGLTVDHVGLPVRSNSPHSARSTHSTPPTNIKVASAIRTPLRPSTPLNGARSSPGPRQRHTIILKYGKRNRKLVEGLLKLPPRPKKPDYRPPVDSTPERSAVDDKTLSRGKAMDNKKRKVEVSPDLANKRYKVTSAILGSSERPTTPVSAGPKSPLIADIGKNLQPNSTHATPKKELKSSAMSRVLSSEDMEVRTPSNDRGTVSTPKSGERTNGDDKQLRPPTSVPSNREDDKSTWQGLSEKYFALGRLLKKEASLVGPEADVRETTNALLASIEALLCFMANTAAQSYVHPHSDPGWHTILPFHISVFRMARKMPRLHGLVVQLGAVCRQIIHKYDMDRLAREPLPDEQCGSAPTPGSDGNTRTNEDCEKYKKKYLDFRDRLVQNSQELQTAWLTGARLLSSEVIKNEYPKTWAKRAKDSSLRGIEKLTPSKLDGTHFFLPLDATTTAFEAISFALAFLQEWTEKEGVVWNPRLEF